MIRLRGKPRDHAALRTVGEITAFVSQHHDPTRDVARRLSQTTRTWADEVLKRDEREAACLDFNALEMGNRLVFFLDQ